LIESLSPDEVEREFKKRLEEERKRKEVAGDEEVNSHYKMFVISTEHKKKHSTLFTVDAYA